MAIDYAALAVLAERLVTEAGRTVDLVRVSETPVDSNTPWSGVDSAEVVLTVPAVQLIPNAVRVFGLSALGDAGKLDGLVSVSELVYIVFAGETDLKQFTLVRDGQDYGIEATQSLKPANTTLLGFIGVRS